MLYNCCRITSSANKEGQFSARIKNRIQVSAPLKFQLVFAKKSYGKTIQHTFTSFSLFLPVKWLRTILCNLCGQGAELTIQWSWVQNH